MIEANNRSALTLQEKEEVARILNKWEKEVLMKNKLETDHVSEVIKDKKGETQK